MHSHLDIEIQATPGGEYKPLVLPDDFSLSVEEQNPVFNDVSFFSYPASVSTRQNMAVLKNIGHRDSALRGMDFEHARARIIVDGLPLNTGQVITQEGAELSKEFQFNIDAQHESFSDLIGDLECRDVDISDKHIVIGEKIGRITINGSVEAQHIREYREDQGVVEGDKMSAVVAELKEVIPAGDEAVIVESPQALGFSFPGRCEGFPEASQKDGKPIVTESFINTSKPYPFPYCNARVAYAHPDYKINNDGVKETSGTVKGNESNPNDSRDYGQYWCLDADRPQSGICFYLLFFLDCLFEQLGVSFDNRELLEIEDFRRLCFFTTACRYNEVDTGKRLVDDEIGTWLRSRNCGGELEFYVYTGKPVEINPDGQVFWSDLSEEYPANTSIYEQFSHLETQDGMLYRHYWNYRKLSSAFRCVAEVNDMEANSDNFPNVRVSELIQSLEASFGILFVYDSESRIVTCKLLKNIYKNSSTRKFSGKVLSFNPVNEKITGVRMIYSAESEKKEQMRNVKYGVKDYDTAYDYIEYPQNRTVTTKTYQDLVTESGLVSTTNQKVYIDRRTGNTYRVKIDSEAEEISRLHPVLFRVAQFKGVEFGDCESRNKDYVKEYSSGIEPLISSIINAKEYNKNTDGTVSPIFAPVLDVEMEHEDLEKEINIIARDFGEVEKTFSWIVFPNDGKVAFNENLTLIMKEKLKLGENYDPTQTDSGNSPLQDIDWGLTMCIMRGGGSDAEIVNYDRNYDGFDNSKWRDTVSTYAMYSDSLDPKGADFDYSGSGEGSGKFSLCIRSWVRPEWSDSPLCDNDEQTPEGVITKKILTRGLFDTFFIHHAYFLTKRKKYNVKSLTTIGQLLDIRNHWDSKYEIDGKTGFINKLRYDIDKNKGITNVVIEFYSL